MRTQDDRDDDLAICRERKDAEIERLRARISQLEQALAQASDNIELQEAEQRGFERGRAYEPR